jgi:hypothetical protein
MVAAGVEAFCLRGVCVWGNNHPLGRRTWSAGGASEALGTITMVGRDHSLLSLFCRPVAGGVWETKLASGFGAYTPCLVQSVVISPSNLALLLVVVYRISGLCYAYSSAPLRFTVQKPAAGHCVGLLLAAFCAVAPLLQVVFGMSAVNLDGENSMPPFEVTSSPLLHVPCKADCLDQCRDRRS